MFLSEQLQTKWSPVLDHPDLPKIEDPYRRAVTAVVLENQERAMAEESRILNEALPNVTGFTTASSAGGATAGYDPILVSLVRRSLPNLMAYDICGVQPMTGPTGLIFAMRSKFANNDSLLGSVGQGNNAGEALYNEADTDFAGTGTHTAFDATVNPGTSNTSIFAAANTGRGVTAATGEDLGSGTAMGAMGFSIEKVTVTANTRALKAEYTLELAQDLKAVHGLDAETELANILSTEILAEINREVVRTIYRTATPGVSFAGTAGTFNLATSGGDTDGRWQVEKYKGLIYAMEREANKIAKDTRRGKGNIIVCSSDVASALAMSGLLDYNSALASQVSLTVDDTGNTFAGTLFGRIKVYVDPYSVQTADYAVVGYKGTVAYDAGLFYCPYVPLQMVRAINPDTFQPKIGFKTRYGLVANPYAEANTIGLGRLANNSNVYYRKFVITNLK